MIRNYITDEEEKVLIFIVLVGFLGIISMLFASKITSQKNIAKVKKQISEDVIVKYDLNKVTFEELANIPEIGANLALDIVTKRDDSLFQNLTDLCNVRGVGKSKFEKIKKYFYRFEEKKNYIKTKKLNINIAKIDDLIKVKGISKNKASKIIALRNKSGGFKAMKNIEKIRGIGPKTVKRMESYFYAGEINERKN
jgi:competence ComEA-like helix-hairpin-helix protein